MTPLRSVVAVAAASLAPATAAHAADLPARVAPAPYVAPLPVFTWTGAYFGLNAGGSFDDQGAFGLSNGPGLTAANTGIGSSRPTGARVLSDGFTGGAQLGYNYQLGNLGGLGSFGGPGSGIVIGFETDAAYIDGGETRNTTNFTTGGLPTTNTFRSGIDFLGTVRGRLGYAVNQFLVYGTGGFAYGDTFNKALLYSPNSTQLRYYGSKGGIQTGYAYGGGVEYALPTGSFLNFFKSSAVTVKVEYLRYDLGSQTFAATGQYAGVANNAYDARVSNEGNLVRAGLNYKF